MKRVAKLIMLALCLMCGLPVANAQSTDYSKLSPQLRSLLLSKKHAAAGRKNSPQKASTIQQVCAFVRTAGTDTTPLTANGCRVLASVGDISIAMVPLGSVPALSRHPQVLRIEAQRGNELMLDTTSTVTRADLVRAATNLPQAYDGSGVVVGVQDVGFDLTHPTFLDADGHLRVSRFWDQISTDTIGSNMSVGAEYTDEASLLAYGHSRDAKLITHGTHTAGIAAGGGYGTPYVGLAPGSELCLVSNVVSTDMQLLSEDELYKYTYAMDALGFKYIFDYAESVGKPCVVNFSEGSTQDFQGNDVLYYEMLSRLVGPGRILVAAAGNSGHLKNYFSKPAGVPSMGTFFRVWSGSLGFTAKSARPFGVRFVAYGSQRDTLTIDTRRVIEAQDSLVYDTLRSGNEEFCVVMQAYKSCYNPSETAFDVMIYGPEHPGMSTPFSVEMVGSEAEIEFYRMSGEMYANDINAQLAAGDNSHSVNSPSSAPCVISVGATAYRSHYTNKSGNVVTNNWGTAGAVARFSSCGPTFDGRIKPEVVAPGVNIISAYGYPYLEAQEQLPEEVVATTELNGHTYGWTSDSGTSMASPVVVGIIAQWLQANPKLSPDDIRTIFASTCSRPDTLTAVPSNTWGYGAIDAYAGLLNVLGLSGISDISAYNPQGLASLRVADGVMEAALKTPATAPFTVSLYSTTGQKLSAHTFAAGTSCASIDVSGCQRGVYAVQISVQEKALHGSLLVRIK